MKIGIFQPCKIGDIIICLPIAKYYHDLGYEIIWPIQQQYMSHFRDVTDYVDFVPYINYNDFIIKYNCNFILDLCFNVFGNETFTKFYNVQRDYTFDELKYKIANVPFGEKWKLNIKRNISKEQTLFDKLVKQEKYIVKQVNSSSHSIKNKPFHINKDFQIIEINSVTDCVFDWLTIIEKSQGVCLIESCFTNLIDQLNIASPKKYCFLKHGYYGHILNNRPQHKQGMPILKNNWEII